MAGESRPGGRFAALAKRAFVACSRLFFTCAYRRRCKREQRGNEIVFLSRQTSQPSYDFAELAAEFTRRGWKAHLFVKKVSPRNLVAYTAHALHEIDLLARCRIAVLDRYDPIVSLLDFDCEPVPPGSDALHRDFPRLPVVIQLWHAFGAYKKFGYQSLDTPEGHPAESARIFSIHRNYSWVVCSGGCARAAFAEAFACPPERVVALDRPEYDELAAMRASLEGERAAGARLRVLMSPTLRKSRESAHPFRDLHGSKDRLERRVDADFTWSFHPLEDGLPAPNDVPAALRESDVVVTDYSSIVYEACLLGKMIVFYVPDIDEFRVSPGLNADPQLLCPALCAYDEDGLAALLSRFAADPGSYPAGELARFAATGFDDAIDRTSGTAASRFADFALARLG